MNDAIEDPLHEQRNPRLAAAGVLVLLAIAALYRAWLDIATIGYVDPEQSQVLLALPVCAVLLYARRAALSRAVLRSSIWGVVLAAAGWALSWYGYTNAVQSLWHLGAVAMAVGAAWSVLGNRAVVVALPAVIALAALVPVPNLLRQDIALPLQKITASGAEIVLVAFGFDVQRLGQTLFYKDKPITIEEACNGMRMVFALLLVCYCFVMAQRFNPFARLVLIALSPLLAVLCNIIRVVPTVIIYGESGDTAGDMFHDISGWAMIALAALMMLGLIRVLKWAEVPIEAPAARPTREPFTDRFRRKALPWPVAPLAALLVVLAVLGHSLSLPTAADARPYHETITQVSEQTSIKIDGLDELPLEIPEGSLKMLRANMSRAVQYTDPGTGATGQYLIIQSKDARDLSGHYPPRCYPNVYGYVEKSNKPRQWEISGLKIDGTEYIFAESNAADATRWVVLHCFVVPDAGTTGQLRVMRAAAADYLRRHHGAAQVQMLFRETAASPEERDALFIKVMDANRDLLLAILDGPSENDDTTP